MKTEKHKCDLGKVGFMRHWRNDSCFSIVADNDIIKVFPTSIVLSRHGFCQFVGKIESEKGTMENVSMEFNFSSHEIEIPRITTSKITS